MQPVALAIIGYGVMGERLLRAALDDQDAPVKLVGVWDPSPDAMQRLAEQFPAVERLASAEAAIDAADCVYVASPPTSHLDYAGQAFARNRAVLCEKPLAVDLKAAQAFVAKSEADGARAAINFPFASSPGVDQLRAWIAEGAVGSYRSVKIEIAFAKWPRAWQEAAASWLDRRVQGGFTREVVSHFVFLTHRLLGPPHLDTGGATYPSGEGSETAMHATLSAGGVPVTIKGTVGETDLADHNLWVLAGMDGSVRLRDWAIAERLGDDGVWRSAPDAMPNEKLRPLVLRRQMDKVARMTRGEAHDLATLREALEVQEIIETILAGR